MAGRRLLLLGRRDLLRGAAIGLGVGADPGILPAVAARASPDTTSKRDLVVLQWSDLTALDPHAASYATDCRVVSNIFDTLVRRHPDGTLHPSLATAWHAPDRPRGTSRCGRTCGGTTALGSPPWTPSTVSIERSTRR